MAYAHMFYGDFRKGDNPRTFLRQFEEDLAELPHLSETKKCYRFYNYCHSGSDAEYWYEELERNSPIVLTSWFTLANHFCVRWLNGSPNLLLEIPKKEPVTVTEPDTATTVSHETTTTTTTTAIPAPANTTAPATYETTERVDRVANACHVVATSAAPPTQLPTITSTSATTTVSNHTITKVEQQDGEQPVKGKGEEQGRRIEKEVEARERETERQEKLDTGEQEGIEESRGEV
jgi:hypothetical protein